MKTSDPQIISNAFSSFFIENPRRIRNAIPDSRENYFNFVPRNERVMTFDPTSPEEVSMFIEGMKKEGSIMDIPRKFLRMSKSHVSPLISNFFNKCLAGGVFPQIFKTARITPVHKKGPLNAISYFRSISILSNICKLFENVIYYRISGFFEDCGLLSDNQFGYR